MKYLKTLRPEQWYKNLVVFAALIFATQLLNPQAWFDSILTFVSFCLLSSSGYIINDLKNADEDKLNPTKKYRPIARGLISSKLAITLATILALTGLAVLLPVNSSTLFTGFMYFILTIVYTFSLRPHYYLGLTAIGLGFVLRALAGYTALELPFTIWLLSCIFILALDLTTAKRGKAKGLVELSIVLVFVYTLYTLQSYIMALTVIPATYVLYRYLNLHPEKYNPIVILKDRRLQLSILTWLIMVLLILHLSGAQ